MDRMGRQIQGDLGEQARIQKLGGKAFNMNRLTKGENSPLVDLATDKSFESVKVFDNPKKYAAHLCDLQASDKWASSKQIGLLNKAAKAVLNGAAELKAKGCLPKGLTTRSGPEAVKTNIRDKGVVAVPDDHVRPARRALLKSIKESPEPYGVKPGDRKGMAARFQALKGRIQGCGRNYGDMLAEAAAKTKGMLQGAKGSAAGKAAGFARPAPPASPPGHAAPGHGTATPPGHSAPGPAPGAPHATPQQSPGVTPPGFGPR